MLYRKEKKYIKHYTFLNHDAQNDKVIQMPIQISQKSDFKDINTVMDLNL